MRRTVILGVMVVACHLVLNVSAGSLETMGGDNSMLVIDKFGNEVGFPIETREIKWFSKEGLAAVRLQNGETAITDTGGELRFKTDRDRLTIFENGLSVFQDPVSNLWGVYASNGVKVVKAEYHWISPFCDGYAIATRNKEYENVLVLNRDGRIVAQVDNSRIAHDYLPPCEKLIPFRDRETNQRGFVDFESKIVVPAKFEEVRPFREHLAGVLFRDGKNVRVGFINTKGDFAIEPRFPIDSELSREITDFSEGIAFVPFDTSFEVKVAINTKGDELFRVRALSVMPMIDGRSAFADHEQGWGYLDNQGNVVVDPIYSLASNFGSGLAVVSKERVSWRFE